MALLVGNVHWNAWLAIVATFVFAALIGLLNGVVVVKTEAAELHRHAGHVLRAPRRQRRRRAAGQPRQHPGRADRHPHPPGAEHAPRTCSAARSRRAPRLPSGYQTAILWFIGVTVVGRLGALPGPRSATGSSRPAATRTPPATSASRCGRTKILLFLTTSLAAALVGDHLVHPGQRPRCPSRASATSSTTSSPRSSAAACSPAATDRRSAPRWAPASSAWRSQGVIYAGWDSSWDFTFLGSDPVPRRGRQHARSTGAALRARR